MLKAYNYISILKNKENNYISFNNILQYLQYSRFFKEQNKNQVKDTWFNRKISNLTINNNLAN